ncbi:hypothetical protein [Mycobacterium marinum]|uniref:hypothetical protein n=1 Tax=Mycobacterium marinum TaxID=1781 RepID=UPI000B96C639|nr:hypothetical protein [Mycobacterium marinum]MDC8984876.1 hypothetical protein [Mycobacterium marinum]MDC8996970.1 hypothetical protein [Mycobacterium marinum]MDC9002180.1 hypothetical protein [Mycobacterium marinum]MDC9012956.1 hypothetical protein [Mycobacterium marinum]MDC9018390.1 hypothetical protein [Mycobacterium marinum]
MLFLTEITWASGLVGAGLDFAIVTGFSDSEAIGLLRGLQRRRKIGGHERAKLLFPNGGRTRKDGIPIINEDALSRLLGARTSGE